MNVIDVRQTSPEPSLLQSFGQEYREHSAVLFGFAQTSPTVKQVSICEQTPSVARGSPSHVLANFKGGGASISSGGILELGCTMRIGSFSRVWLSAETSTAATHLPFHTRQCSRKVFGRPTWRHHLHAVSLLPVARWSQGSAGALIFFAPTGFMLFHAAISTGSGASRLHCDINSISE